MATGQSIQRVILAIEQPDLEAGARQYCSGLFPDCTTELISLEEFAQSLEKESVPEELRILMLHADENGQLQKSSPIVRSLLTTRAPVLVARHSRGGTVPDPEIRRIVVPLDGSITAGQAIPIASRVARSLNVPVRFVMVIDPSRVIPPAYAYDPEAQAMIEELRQTSHWALSQAESAMERDGVIADSTLLLGPVYESLSRSIVNGDLVIMTTHGPVRKGSRTSESVALQTLVSVPQPMLIMRAGPETPLVIDAYQVGPRGESVQDETGPTD